MDDKQEMIDIIETVYRGASKGRGLVVSPKVTTHLFLLNFIFKMTLRKAMRRSEKDGTPPAEDKAMLLVKAVRSFWEVSLQYLSLAIAHHPCPAGVAF
ncbi:hypothetical protein BDV93DRAFT_289416 [Ceratobasidium sp. AG-I]|nr:hypothetical protein BDV93DRAFT_289416 [Ceratobasidium sp. AG-I]